MERRSRLRLTREGRFTLLVLIAFLVGALNTGTNLLYLLAGLFCSAYALNAVVPWRALRGLHVVRQAPNEVTRGEAVTLRYQVSCKAPLPFAVRIDEDPVPAARLRREAVGVAGLEAGRCVVSAQARFAHRGLVQLPGLRLVCRAPFGLLEREVRVQAPARVLVLPRRRPLREGLLESALRPAPAASRRWWPLAPERRDAVRALRDYAPGDDRRAVHWRASARRGDLVVREFERSAPDDVLLALDLGGAAAEDPALADAAAEVAASLLAALVRAGRRHSVVVAGHGPPAALPPGEGHEALRRALRALARALPARRPDLSAAARASARHAAGAEVVVVSTRALRPPLPWPAARCVSLPTLAEAEASFAAEGAP